MKNELSQIRTKILGSGLKSTPQRIAVYKLFGWPLRPSDGGSSLSGTTPRFSGLSLQRYIMFWIRCVKKN